MINVLYDGINYYGLVDGDADPFIMPTMTGIITGDYSTYQNSVYNNMPFWKCFSGADYWYCATSGSNHEAYGQLMTPRPVRITKVQINAPTGAGVNAAHVPSSIKLKGSNNGVIWYELGDFTNLGGNNWECTVNNPNYYLYTRISLFTNVGYAQLGQIKITGYLNDLSYKGVIIDGNQH